MILVTNEAIDIGLWLSGTVFNENESLWIWLIKKLKVSKNVKKKI